MVIVLAGVVLTACATTKKSGTQISGDVYTGTETVKYLAILKKSKNDNTFSRLSTEESVNKKSNVTKKINNRQ